MNFFKPQVVSKPTVEDDLRNANSAYHNAQAHVEAALNALDAAADAHGAVMLTASEQIARLVDVQAAARDAKVGANTLASNIRQAQQSG